MALFEDLSAFSQKPLERLVTYDVLVDPHTGAALASLQGQPIARADAQGVKLQFRALTPVEQSEVDHLAAGLSAPAKYRDDPKRGRVHDGYDLDHPDYRRAQGQVLAKQVAATVLLGVIGLRESVPGVGLEDKIETLRRSWSGNLLSSLAGAIHLLSPSVAELSEVFFSTDSASSPNSPPTGKSSKPRRPREAKTGAANKPSPPTTSPDLSTKPPAGPTTAGETGATKPPSDEPKSSPTIEKNNSEKT